MGSFRLRTIQASILRVERSLHENEAKPYDWQSIFLEVQIDLSHTMQFAIAVSGRFDPFLLSKF